MARRATYIRESSRGDAYQLNVDAGNFIHVGDWMSQIKVRYLLRAMKMIGYDAINVGFKDTVLGASLLSDLRSRYRLPYVSANVYYEDTGELFAEPFIIKKFGRPRFFFWRAPDVTVGILGLNGLTPPQQMPPQPEDDRKLMVGDPYEAARDAMKTLKANGCDVIIALVQMSTAQCDSLVELVAGIDLLVGGRTSRQTLEPELRSGVPMVEPGWQGKNEGNLLLNLDERNRVTSWEGKLQRLDESIGEDSTMVALIAEYKEGLHEAQINQPRPENVQEVYAGAERCGSCHQAQYEQWKTTAHADAYASLESSTREDEGKKFECLPCHTTGFRQYNGYWSVDTTPEMANVQCETCHGFGMRHLLNREQGVERHKLPDGRLMPELPIITMYTCVRCHNQERDPEFDFPEDRRKVAH